MFRLLFIFFVLVCANNAFTQSTDLYYRISIPNNKEQITKVEKLGIELEHAYKAEKNNLVLEVSQQELNGLIANNVPYTVLIKDLTDYYVKRNKEQNFNQRSYSDCFPELPIDTPKHFHLGSMGGFYTYEEYLAVLDSMHTLYPNLISTSKPIGNFLTYDGNPLLWIKISDNPETDENEPKALFTALHHAREPISLTQMVYFMWYILENYGSNKEISALINRTELYFVPMINPDGYIYNQLSNPQGGGLWRKNISPNFDLNLGTDLNRNYGYNWSFDDLGSSPSTDSEVYRGASSFSEIETQAIKSFCNSHPFEIALNYHGYGNYVLYPWGYNGINCTDSVAFQSLAKQMVHKNKFTAGTTIQTVGYYANGNSDDWMYGDNSQHDPILAMTVEVGEYNDGFWPTENRIIPLCINTLDINLDAVRYLHNYLKAEMTGLPALTGEDKSLKINTRQLGKRPSSTVVSLEELHNKMSFIEPAKLLYLSSNIDSVLDFTFNFSNVNSGDSLFLIIKTSDNISTRADTVIMEYFDTKKSFFKDDCSTMNNWDGEGAWGISDEDYVSPGGCLADSPIGNYDEGVYTKLSSKSSFMIDGKYSRVYIKYYAKWAIERNWDYAAVYLLNTNTDEKSYLCTKHASQGKDFQIYDEPLYEGNSLEWKEEIADITKLIGQPFNMNVRMSADGLDERDGINIDDIEITAFRSFLTDVKEGTGGKLNIYPNPVRDVLNIKSDKILSRLEVSDMYGRLLWSREFEHNETNFKIPPFIKSGIYFVKLIDLNGTFQLQKCEVITD
ncbi:MAG TPA: M14 family zinc carboxypeptidase [Saprospiraceae bacterium]|nr:M14 family zinc carboxypeptidase [Saprospiraceae bacterium]